MWALSAALPSPCSSGTGQAGEEMPVFGEGWDGGGFAVRSGLHRDG